MRQLGKHRSVAVRIKVIDEMQSRRSAHCADARHREACKLCQSLSAEAGAAGTKDHDVGRSVRDFACGTADRIKVAVGFRQEKQWQGAVGMTGAQPVERVLSAAQGSFQYSRADALHSDTFFATAIDRLDKTHTGICLESRGRRNGGNSA